MTSKQETGKAPEGQPRRAVPYFGQQVDQDFAYIEEKLGNYLAQRRERIYDLLRDMDEVAVRLNERRRRIQYLDDALREAIRRRRAAI